MENMLKLPEEWFNGKQMIVAGDQMTVARLRALKFQRRSDVSPYARLEWMEPLIQLFHLQMLYSGTIINNYYGERKAPGSLGFYISVLKRKRVGPVKQDFHAADELLRHSFEALVMRLWMTEFGCDRLDDLDKLLGEMNTRALEDKINSGIESITSVWLDRFQLTTKHNVLSKNSALFMKDMMLYIELSDAIKAGDIGRIDETLKPLTVIFQAGQTKNYALELLHLHCLLNHASDNKRKEAIMSSWLINTTGKKNRWIPADLYQEHNNLMTKVTHAVRGTNSPYETLANLVAPNIHVFQEVCSKVESIYHTPNRGNHHTSKRSVGDIKRLLESIKDHGILDINRCTAN
ncbi:hypothetical protein BGX20_006542, partial [Mortierella sp. AD010]